MVSHYHWLLFNNAAVFFLALCRPSIPPLSCLNNGRFKCCAHSTPPPSRFESKFFASSADYHDVASQCGISNLARRLNAILVEHIRLLLPGLRRRIQVWV